MFRYDENPSYLYYGEHLAEPRYLELFEGNRILLRRIVGDRLILTPIEETYVADQLLHTVKPLSINHKFMSGLLQSKLMKYYFVKRYNRNEKTFPEIRVGELKSLPIITRPDPRIINSVNQMVNLVADLNKSVSQFIKYFKGKIDLTIPSRKLQSWHDLDFPTFIKELNKAINKENRAHRKNDEPEIVKLTKKDEFEWMELFEENKKKAQALQSQIDATEKEIDRMVYELYGLTEEEIGIVERA